MLARLVQVEDIKAVMGADCGYEVALLLEPAPPAPLEAIVDAVVVLVNEPRTPVTTEVESKAGTSAAGAANDTGPLRLPRGPRTRHCCSTVEVTRGRGCRRRG